MLETCLALVLGNLFGRFPNLRVASVELGSAWVDYCLYTLDHSGGLLGRHVEAYGVTVADLPSDIFKEHIWVSPFPEDDITHLVDSIGCATRAPRFGLAAPRGHPAADRVPAAARQARRRERAADHARQRAGAAHVSTRPRPSRSRSTSTRRSSTTSTRGCGTSAGPTIPTTRAGSFGVNRAYLEEFVGWWLDEYDWRAVEGADQRAAQLPGHDRRPGRPLRPRAGQRARSAAIRAHARMAVELLGLPQGDRPAVRPGRVRR